MTPDSLHSTPMTAKPNALRPEIAARFQDDGVVEAYAYREPYPPEVFDILAELIVDTPRAVLDIGCGRGEVARPLLSLADRVDAVDWSEAMLAKGKTLPGGVEDTKVNPNFFRFQF